MTRLVSLRSAIPFKKRDRRPKGLGARGETAEVYTFGMAYAINEK